MNRFNKAFTYLIDNEGSYSNNPHDPGGKTIYGITERDYPEIYQQVVLLWSMGYKELALNRVKSFYRKEFWNNLYEKINDSSLAFKIFDLSVNRGRKKAVKLLQDTLYFDFGLTLARDGIFGNISLAAVNSVDNEKLYEAYIHRCEMSYRSLKNFIYFGKGWLNRLFRRHYL